MVTLLLLALSLAPDVVHARDGRKIEGKVLEYEHFLEVEPADPKLRPVKILRRDVLKVDLAPNFVRCPEILPFPFDALEKGEYRYVSRGRILVCLPQPPLRKLVGIDVVLGKKVWDIDLPDRAGDPVLAGKTLYFTQRTKEVDDAKKVRIGGTPFSKEVHKLTVTAADPETAERFWSHTFDNNDRKDLLWEFHTGIPPTLHFLPDRVVIRAVKIGHPMDAGANVDKTTSVKFVTFYSYDPVQKKLLSAIDSRDAADMGSFPWFTSDAVVTQVYEGQSRFKLACVSMKDGKLRWQTEPFAQGTLFEVNDDVAYVADATHLWAWSVKTGKKLDKWVVEQIGGQIAEVDANFVYLYRSRRAPRGMLAFDVKKAEEAWRIPMGDTDEFSHLMLAGHRLLFTDRTNSIRCWDTLARKELWKWTGPGLGLVQWAKIQGSSLTFNKDGRLWCLELDSGRKLWEVKGQYQKVHQVGDAGAVGFRVAGAGADLIHERKLPPRAEFLTSTGTPLRFALGDDAWSPPAWGDGRIYTLSLSGQLAAIDLDGPKTAWVQKASAQPLQASVAPTLHSGRIAVCVPSEAVFYAPDGTKSGSTRHSPVRNERPLDAVPGGLLVATGSGFAAVDPATAQKTGEVPIRSVGAWTLSEGSVFAVATGGLHALDLKSWKTADSPRALPAGVTALAAQGGRIWAATGAFGFGEAVVEGDFRSVFRAKSQDPKVSLRFRGALAAAEGRVWYAHADGELGCFDPATGKTDWTFAAPDFTSPLLVHGGRVWLSAAGRGLYGLNAKTGAVEWKTEPLPDAALFTPVLRDGKAVFWSADGWLVATE